MTSHTGRLYALAIGLIVFFLAWTLVAAHPWPTAAAPDPRLQALAVREAHLRQVAAQVNKRRQHSAQVRIVNLPPLTVTRTS